MHNTTRAISNHVPPHDSQFHVAATGDTKIFNRAKKQRFYSRAITQSKLSNQKTRVLRTIAFFCSFIEISGIRGAGRTNFKK
jgi:hypothetical protein